VNGWESGKRGKGKEEEAAFVKGREVYGWESGKRGKGKEEEATFVIRREERNPKTQ
jgi:hypothetical protein